MTQTHEQSAPAIARRSLAWKPIQCRSTESHFDEMEANLLRSYGNNDTVENRQLQMPDASTGQEACLSGSA